MNLMNKMIGENGPESVVKEEAEHPLGENLNNMINEIKIKEECLWNDCKEQENFSIKTQFDIDPKTENGVEQIKEEPRKSEGEENIVFPLVAFINERDIKKESEVFDDTALQLMNVMMSDATDIKDNEVSSENSLRNVSSEELVSKHLESHQYTAKFEVTSECFSHVCDVCNKVFKSELLLNGHGIIHGTMFPDCSYLCDICGETFIHESKLNQHMIMHTREHNVMMPDATDIKDNEVISKNSSRNVSREELVSKHIESCQYTAKFEVTSERFSRVCDVYNKVFKSELLLNGHGIIHGTMFPDCPYLCDICGKSFIHESKLNRHMIMHTCERPFTCNKCHKNFPHKSYLKTHMRTHEVLPFSCKVCQETYSHKSSFLRHVHLHKNNKYTLILPKIM